MLKIIIKISIFMPTHSLSIYFLHHEALFVGRLSLFTCCMPNRLFSLNNVNKLLSDDVSPALQIRVPQLVVAGRR